jgi:hypothetical protein
MKFPIKSCMAAIAALGWVATAQAQFAVSLGPQSPDPAPPGGSFDVPINWTGDGARQGFQVDIDFDDAVLTADTTNCLTGAATTSSNCNFSSCAAPTGDTNTVRLLVACSGPLADGNIGSLTFTAAAGATAPSTSTISLSNEVPPGATLTTVTVNIDDVVVAATITASDATAAEPSGNDGEFTVTLSAPAPAGGTVVNYTVSGTATNGVDYANLGGSVTVPAGATTVTIPVAVIDDSFQETDETVILTLDGGGSSATVTISDDGDPDVAGPMISVNTTSLTLSATPGGTATQTITVTDIGDGTLALTAITLAGAGAGDFTTGGTCAAGAAVPAGGCTITVTFTAPATEGTSSATITIDSNGGSSTVAVTGISATVVIPTLSEWAMIIMASLMLMLGAVTLRRNGYLK